MATSNVTLDIAGGPDQPYAFGAVLVGRAVPAGSTTGYVDGSLEAVPLGNPPTVLGANGFVPLTQGKVYLFVLPSGVRTYRLVPASATVNFSDLAEVIPVIDAPGYLADDLMTSVAADTNSHFREELDALFAATMAGTVADGAVGALVNSGPSTKAALGNEAKDPTSPLGQSIQGKAIVAALIYGGN